MRDTLRADRLGAGQVSFFTLAAAATLTVVAGVVPTGYATTGVVGIPLAFVVVGVVLLIFAVGYVAMAGQIQNAGAFYAFISQGLSRRLGVGAAALALIAYNCLQVGLYGAIGVATPPVMQRYLHLNPPWWACALVALGITAVLGQQQVGLNSRVLAVLLMAEVAVVVVYSIADIVSPAGGHVSYTTLAPSSLFGSGLGSMLALAILGFVGFEGAAVFSEESRDRRRTVSIATYSTIGAILALYTVASWAMSVGTGATHIVSASRAQGTELIFSLAGARLGQPAADLGHLLFVTSIGAAMLSFHNTTSRYKYALGREGVLPSVFARTGLRSGAPVVASAAQSVLALIVVVTFAVEGWDPLVQLFYWGGTIGGLAVLILLILTSLSVIWFFAFTKSHHQESRWATLVAPGLASIALLVIFVLAMVNLPTLLGVPAGHPLIKVIPLVFVAVFIVGAARAVSLSHRRPAVYDGIGMGSRPAPQRPNRAASPITGIS